jgi:hypothetical protein
MRRIASSVVMPRFSMVRAVLTGTTGEIEGSLRQEVLGDLYVPPIPGSDRSIRMDVFCTCTLIIQPPLWRNASYNTIPAEVERLRPRTFSDGIGMVNDVRLARSSSGDLGLLAEDDVITWLKPGLQIAPFNHTQIEEPPFLRQPASVSRSATVSEKQISVVETARLRYRSSGKTERPTRCRTVRCSQSGNITGVGRISGRSNDIKWFHT